VRATIEDLKMERAMDWMLRFGQFAKTADAGAVRAYLTQAGREREFFAAIDCTNSLRRKLEPRPPRPDYLKPVE
jgi:hypothetical protein